MSMSKTVQLPWDWYFDHQHPYSSFAERETFDTREERDRVMLTWFFLTGNEVVRFNDGLKTYIKGVTSDESFYHSWWTITEANRMSEEEKATVEKYGLVGMEVESA